jgi:hypothetical protein
MNEISRCCRLLGVKHGASIEEVKKTYRDLVQVWHPDRFSSNERLQAKAQEQLKEINLAYDYLIEHGFQNGFLVEPADDVLPVSPADESGPAPDGTSAQPANSPEPTAAWPEEEPQKAAEPRNAFWALIIAGAVLAGGGVLLYLRIHGRAQSLVPLQTGTTNVAAPTQFTENTNAVGEPAVVTPANNPPPPAPSGRSYPYTKEVVDALTGSFGLDWVQSAYLLSPPFALRAKLKQTDLTDIRLHYGLGTVIFNWSDHPKELRVHDPRTANITPTPDRGLLLPDRLHELVWEITTNNMSVSVDGQIRYQGKGDYGGVKAYPGIGPTNGTTSLESFVLETPLPLEDTAPPERDHGPIPGDLLSSMVPEKNVRLTNAPDGLVLWTVGDPETRLMSRQTFQPPFVIRTRAKTDALNLRLYCGAGEVIFNWERNPEELRVHDPLSGQQMPVPGRGLISPNEWHAIVWEVQPTGMRLFVDGAVRFQNRRDYQGLDSRVGIGPAMSKVTVDYFLVETK